LYLKAITRECACREATTTS